VRIIILCFFKSHYDHWAVIIYQKDHWMESKTLKLVRVLCFYHIALVKLSVRLMLIKTLPQQSRFLFNADNIASLAQTFIIILCDIVRALNKGLGFSIYCSICFVYWKEGLTRKGVFSFVGKFVRSHRMKKCFFDLLPEIFLYSLTKGFWDRGTRIRG